MKFFIAYFNTAKGQFDYDILAHDFSNAEALARDIAATQGMEFLRVVADESMIFQK